MMSNKITTIFVDFFVFIHGISRISKKQAKPQISQISQISQNLQFFFHQQRPIIGYLQIADALRTDDHGMAAA